MSKSPPFNETSGVPALTADKLSKNCVSTHQAQIASIPQFDPRKYSQYVADLDLTEEQKVEFLGTLWWIMVAFVNLGFGVDSVIPALTQITSENGENELQDVIPTHEFNVAADDDATKKVD